MEKEESCGFGKFCGNVGSMCIALQVTAALALVGILGYLFVTQELLK